jgi:hypothetical protein
MESTKLAPVLTLHPSLRRFQDMGKARREPDTEILYHAMG